MLPRGERKEGDVFPWTDLTGTINNVASTAADECMSQNLRTETGGEHFDLMTVMFWSDKGARLVRKWSQYPNKVIVIG